MAECLNGIFAEINLIMPIARPGLVKPIAEPWANDPVNGYQFFHHQDFFFNKF